MSERTLVIGDVHGCLEELDELLRAAEHRPGRDDVVFVGDLLDRGPDSAGVVRRAREIGARCCYGNHEDKHVRWARHEARRRRDPGYRNPMKSMSEADREAHEALRPEDLDWIATLPSHLRVHDHLVVHAGFEPARPLEAQKRATMARIRWVDDDGRMTTGDDPWVAPPGAARWSERWVDGPSVLYGHHVLSVGAPFVDRPADGVACWAIDTGCCFGGRLTAVELPSERVVQVDARATYHRRKGTLATEAQAEGPAEGTARPTE